MKRLAALLLVISSPALAGPWCTVDQYGNGLACYYVNLDQCRQAAQNIRGACIANPQPAYQAPPAPVYQAPQNNNAFQQGYQNAQGPAQAAQQGYEQGRRRKMERERHEAEMRAQQAAAQPYYPEPPRTDTFAHVYRQPEAQSQPQPQPQPPPQPQRVTYSCPIPNGGGAPYVTTVAAVGCVVIAVE